MILTFLPEFSFLGIEFHFLKHIHPTYKLDPGGGMFYWGPWRICKERLWKWASLSIGAPLGNLEGISFHGDFERRMRFFYQEILYRGIRETRKRRLRKRATFFIGTPLGNLEGVYFTGDFWDIDGGLWKRNISFCGSSVRGTWRSGSYTWEVLELGISLHRGLLGNVERGSFTGDFERWRKEGLRDM